MNIAACLIVRNEGRDIAEWIAYHATAGFDAFLVYDNASSDDTAAALSSAARVLDVRTVHWPFHTPRAQTAAYAHAIQAYGREFDWIAFIDSDEFIVTHGHHSIHSLCANAGAAAGIGINWAMFGTSGHVGIPNALVIEAFTRRSSNAFPANRHVKSIVRPLAVAGCLNPHAFHLDGAIVTASGSPLVWQTHGGAVVAGLADPEPDFTVAQINHYFTRSRAHWANKVARGYPNPASNAKLRHFDHYDRNEVEDRSALRNVAAVRSCRTALIRQDRPVRMPALPPHTAWQPTYQASLSG